MKIGFQTSKFGRVMMIDKVRFWPTKKIKIKDLHDYKDNPRRTSKQEYERLVADIKKHGFHTVIKVDQNNTIIGGHLRKKALIGAGMSPNDEIEVKYSPEPLTEEEFQELNVKDNRHYSEFDKDKLANHFDTIKCIEWGVPLKEFEISSQDIKDKIKSLDSDKDEVKCTSCGRPL